MSKFLRSIISVTLVLVIVILTTACGEDEQKNFPEKKPERPVQKNEPTEAEKAIENNVRSALRAVVIVVMEYQRCNNKELPGSFSDLEQFALGLENKKMAEILIDTPKQNNISIEYKRVIKDDGNAYFIATAFSPDKKQKMVYDSSMPYWQRAPYTQDIKIEPVN